MLRIQLMLALLIAGCISYAQLETVHPAFDTATTRLSKGDAEVGGYNHQMTPVSLRMHRVSMGYCIRLAYGLSVQRPYELVGPAWINPPTDILFDIIASVDQPTSTENMKRMLQSLLTERFGLSVHREQRAVAAYSLLPGDREPKLTPSPAGAETKVELGSDAHQFIFQHVSMAQLALQLGPPMTSRPVVDHTGFAGSYDFTLDLGRYLRDPESGKVITSENGGVDEEAAALRAVRDQLGLSVKEGSTPVDVLVIDHVEKRPLKEQ